MTFSLFSPFCYFLRRPYVLLCVFISLALLFVNTGFCASNVTEQYKAGNRLNLREMQHQVSAASIVTPPWMGPHDGPKAKSGRSIAIISEDLRNGGILSVAQGVREAAKILDWQVKVFDAGGSPEGRKRAASQALKAEPDGVILDGADAKIMHELLVPFTKRNIPIVGWHVGSVAGALTKGHVAMNVSTAPLEVARITAMAAIVESKGQVGAVIFTDSNYKIAMAKANAMAEVIRACAKCTLLEIRDVAIADSARTMPAVTRELLNRYGKAWTHGLAINDIYFDYAVPEFILAGPKAQHIKLLSAGDGSSAAFLRIQAGTFQVGTVSEPLNLHGWQLVDELNRLLEGVATSGYVLPVHLVTPKNVLHDGGLHFHYDPANGYKDIYRRIWGR